MKNNEWKSIKDVGYPTTKDFVETKISDKDGERNFQKLRYENDAWFLPDGMYVYYHPTHWK